MSWSGYHPNAAISLASKCLFVYASLSACHYKTIIICQSHDPTELFTNSKLSNAAIGFLSCIKLDDCRILRLWKCESVSRVKHHRVCLFFLSFFAEWADSNAKAIYDPANDLPNKQKVTKLGLEIIVWSSGLHHKKWYSATLEACL